MLSELCLRSSVTLIKNLSALKAQSRAKTVVWWQSPGPKINWNERVKVLTNGYLSKLSQRSIFYSPKPLCSKPLVTSYLMHFTLFDLMQLDSDKANAFLIPKYYLPFLLLQLSQNKKEISGKKYVYCVRYPLSFSLRGLRLMRRKHFPFLCCVGFFDRQRCLETMTFLQMFSCSSRLWHIFW